MRTIAAKAKLTNPLVKQYLAQAKPDQKLLVRDSACTGLILAVNTRSASWQCEYRPKGRRADGRQLPTRHMKLGDVATLDLPLARAKCLAVRGAVAEGRDPAQEATVAVAVRVEERKKERTCGEFAAEYADWFDGRAVKVKTKVDERRQVIQALALIGAEGLPPGELRRSHMIAVLDQLRSPAKARKVFGSLSSFLAYLVDREVITVNPATQIDRRRRPKAPKARSRFLSLPELGAVYRGCGELSSVRGQVIDKAAWSRQARFAVLIPARIGEIAGMLWGHLDLKAGLWAQPGQLVKNGSAHTFPLPCSALGLLEEQRTALREAGLGVGPADRVWLGAKGGDAFHVWGCMLPCLQEHSGVTDWSWHDLRRTCVSHLAEAGVAESTADALLNHRQSATRPGVMAVYQRSDRMAERRQALEQWESIVLNAAAKEG